jgi:CheY-like chemotaxis protein
MAERLKVLLLEENDEVLKWFQTVLDNSRFECKIARNQEDFKNSITNQHIDIVILGLPVTGVSNGEAIQEVISFAPDLPIIILTEAASESEVLDCVNKGAHGFIRKGLIGSSLINPIILQAFERQKALMSDRESQRLLDNLIRHLPGFIYRCRDDENWTTDYLSGGFEDLTGFQADDFLSTRKNITSLIHPDDLKKTQAEIQKLRGKKKDFHLEYRIITADRKEKWCVGEREFCYGQIR